MMLRRGEACNECRRRKLKCNAIKPRCHLCQRDGKECKYQGLVPLSRQIATSTLVLENRVLDLEQKLQSLASQQVVGSHETYGPPIQMTGNWWEPDELALPIKNYLIGIFNMHQHHCQFGVMIPQMVIKTLTTPESNLVHPALLEAIYLLACFFTEKFHYAQALGRYEEKFLARARNACANSLSFSDNLLDFIRSSNLIVWYLFVNGRFLEAYHMHCGTARFAISCGLHRISSPVFQTPPNIVPPALLPPVKDQLELAERIYVWWQVYMADKMVAILTGLIGALPSQSHKDEQIETVFPRDFEDYEKGQVNDFEYQTIRQIYEDPPEGQTDELRPDTTWTTYLKMLTLLEHATRFNLLHRYQLHTIEVQKPVATTRPSHEGLDVQGHNTADLGAILSASVAHGVFIELHENLANVEPDSYKIRLSAAKAVATLARSFINVDYNRLCIVFGHVWAKSAKVLVLHVITSKKGKMEVHKLEDIERVQADLEILMDVLGQLKNVYPVLAQRWDQINAIMKAQDIKFGN